MSFPDTEEVSLPVAVELPATELGHNHRSLPSQVFACFRPVRSRLMVAWGDVPTWVTAGVAFLALIGASLAYRTQSEQLRLQRIQLADQTRVQEREQANQIDVVWQHIDSRA